MSGGSPHASNDLTSLLDASGSLETALYSPVSEPKQALVEVALESKESYR